MSRRHNTQTDPSLIQVSRPTRQPLQDVLTAWDALEHPVSNDNNLHDFLEQHFQPAGAELIPLPDDAAADLTANATFLSKMNNTINAEFVASVVDIWANLTRTFNASSVCATCESSLIPPRRPFVVAGGRFREPYYWDSYWIIQGLLRTGGGYVGISRNQIENFLDNVDDFGFVPNGARRYYLNRSQPPLLAQMVRIYVEHTGDTSILERALPLLIKEQEFFETNRTVDVTVDNQTYTLNRSVYPRIRARNSQHTGNNSPLVHRYNVDNNQPRPESYYEDYQQANNATFIAADGTPHPAAHNLTQAERDTLYQNLASGAESGWDYSSRFLSRPLDAVVDTTTFPLRSLNIINIIPVDLNAILYWNEHTIAALLTTTNRTPEAQTWHDRAARRARAMHAVLWDERLATYQDYNLTSRARQSLTARDADALPFETDIPGAEPQDYQLAFSVAQLTPFLTGAASPHIRDDPSAVRRAFARVERYLDARAGGIAPTNFRSGQQWDQPSVWPPHMQMLIEALLLRSEEPEPELVQSGTTTGSRRDEADRAWARGLALRLAQRYLDSTYCTWRATGGSTPSSPKLASVVNTTADRGGIMFEKYSDASLGRAGGGGEYEVVTGFGWTNGVLIWVADTFGPLLQSPPCLGVDYVFPEDES